MSTGSCRMVSKLGFLVQDSSPVPLQSDFLVKHVCGTEDPSSHKATPTLS